RVTLDPAYYEEKLAELFPDCTLTVQQSKEALIVNGYLRGNDQIVQLNKFFEKTGENYVDMTSIAGVQQVQLEVRVAEVSKTALRSFGVNAITAQDRFLGVSRVGSSGSGILAPLLGINPSPDAGSIGVGGEDLSGGSFWTMFLGFPNSDLAFFIEALAENSYLRLLANPTLVALSGEEATFLAGGEFPIPVVQGSGGAGVGGTSSITIEYREYGVRLVFRPIVQGDGTIRLYVAPEVSDLTNVGAVQIEDFTIPALFTRKASTTLELKSGQSFAMAGLIQSDVDAIRSVVPGIGELPVLGPLFRSVRYETKETELVILVTATLVEPLSLTSMPPLPGSLHVDPNDWEFYIQGQIKGGRPASITPDDSEWLSELGLDKLAGPGAWDSYDSTLSTYGPEDNE
ncbi:MAG: type II and III secretion system protein family protein, partial [Planctomycetota bacterium]